MAVRNVLEIRPALGGFVLFDTDEQEAIMQFGSREAAAEFLSQLMLDEAYEQAPGDQELGAQGN